MKLDERIRLVVTTGRNTPRSFTFLGPQVTLGRSQDNDLCLSSSYVSRHHGFFVLKEDGWSYQDVESKNKTYIMTSDERPEGGTSSAFIPLKPGPHRLRGSERLRIGDVLIEIMPFPSPLFKVVPGEDKPPSIHSIWTTHQALTLLDLPEHGAQGTLRTLFDTAQQLATCREETEIFLILQRVIESTVPTVSHVLLLEPERESNDDFQVRWHWRRHGLQTDPPHFSRTLLQRVLKEGTSILYDENLPITESVHLASLSSTVCVPIRGTQGYLGVLQADCRDSRATLKSADLHLLTLLGEQVAASLDRMRTAQRIEKMFEGFVQASVSIIESRDKYTAGHSERVANYSVVVAQAIHDLQEGSFHNTFFSGTALRTLRYAALLHDFGKVGVRESVLLKARKLHEWQIDEIRSRFALAKMQARALAAEKWVQALRENPESFHMLIGTDPDFNERVKWLDQEETWFLTLLGVDPIKSHDLVRLRHLTDYVDGLQLLTPQELEDILACRGTLTPSERLEIERHATITRCFLEQIPWPDELREIPTIAGSHHEKLDGSGYPNRITSLPLEVRILTISDIYDALTGGGRSYRDPMTPQEAFELLERDARRQAIDREVFTVFQKVIRQA